MEMTDDFGVTEPDWIIYTLLHRKPQGFTEKDFLAKARRVGVTRQQMSETLAEWESLGHIQQAVLSEGNTGNPSWRVRTRIR